MNAQETVSVIIPARNEEANISRAVMSVAEQAEVSEIIVVNDQSTDGTARVLENLSAKVPKLRVLEAGPLPEGWVGKNHACWVGAQRATGAWFLFTDADAVHMRGSAERALLQAAANHVSMLSVSPTQEMQHWWERAIIPFIFCRLSQLYSYARINDPASRAAAANGQFLLIRREAYEKIGGHEAVRGEVLEDVALAARAKQMGERLIFEPDDGMVRVRMYTAFGQMWEGWTKNLCPLITHAGQRVTREFVYVFPLIPFLCFLFAPVYPILAALGVLLLAGRHASYAASLRRNRFPASSVIYYVPAVLLYCAALAVSDWHYARGRVNWKGRQYPVNRVEKQDSRNNV